MFFIEFFLCNPASGSDVPVFGQVPENKGKNIKPSYLVVKVGSWGENAAQIHRFFGWNNTNFCLRVGYALMWPLSRRCNNNLKCKAPQLHIRRGRQ